MQEPVLQRQASNSPQILQSHPLQVQLRNLPELVQENSQRVHRWPVPEHFQTFRGPEPVLQRPASNSPQSLQSHPGRELLRNRPVRAQENSQRVHPSLVRGYYQRDHRELVRVHRTGCWREHQILWRALQSRPVRVLHQRSERVQHQSHPVPGQHQTHHRQILREPGQVFRRYLHYV